MRKYATILEQDAKIRSFIMQKYDSAGIANIKIERTYKLGNIFLKIYVAKPVVIVEKSGSGIVCLKNQLKKQVDAINKIHVKIIKVKKPDSKAILLAKFISNQLVRRVAFKRAVRKAIERTQDQKIKGIKVQISGRLNGAEIARSEWVKQGRMPLQMLRADIDYATTTAKTIYGILGIKVWLFKGEVI